MPASSIVVVKKSSLKMHQSPDKVVLEAAQEPPIAHSLAPHFQNGVKVFFSAKKRHALTILLHNGRANSVASWPRLI